MEQAKLRDRTRAVFATRHYGVRTYGPPRLAEGALIRRQPTYNAPGSHLPPASSSRVACYDRTVTGASPVMRLQEVLEGGAGGAQ